MPKLFPISPLTKPKIDIVLQQSKSLAMKKMSVRILGPSLEELFEFFQKEMIPDYQNNTDNMFILCFEQFYFRNNSSQMNMVVVKKKSSYLFLDIIGAAGGQGLFGMTWGSERGFSRKMRKKIDGLCNEKGWKIIDEEES
jgi:hypothetical protein